MRTFTKMAHALSCPSPEGCDCLADEWNKLRKKEFDFGCALKEICFPVAAMREKLEEGEVLNGQMAMQLASDSNYLREIAKKALVAGGWIEDF